MGEGGVRQAGMRCVLAVVVATLLSAVLVTTPSGAQTGTDLGTTKSGLRSLGDELDRGVDTVRVFERWDSVFPDAEERLHLTEGRTLLVSIFPQRTDDTFIPWADIASAQPGSEIHDEIVRWATRLAPYEGQVYVTFNHEPEAAKNLALGSAADFRAAWAAVMQVFDDEGLATLGRLFVVTSPSFDYPIEDRRAFDHWYPGDDTVDAVGGDAYNFFGCRPAEPAGWISFADLIEGQRAWGATHPGIEMMLPEFASVADPADPDRRPSWFADAAATLADPAYDQFSIVSYFYEFDPLNPGCDYLPRTDGEVQAFYDMAGDPALGGTPPVGPQPPTRCDMEEIDGAAVIGWRPSYRPDHYEIARLDGETTTIVSAGTGLSFSEPAVVGASYTVAAVDGAGVVSAPAACDEPDPDPPPLAPPSDCEWARDEGFITVSWISVADAAGYVVYRTVNGNGPYWRGRTTDTELVDSDIFANLTYQVRSRAIDGSLSGAATTCVDTSPPLVGLDDPEPPTACGFVRADGAVTVTWQPGLGATETVVSRSVDGNGPYWRARTAASEFVDSDRAGEMAYFAASRSDAGILSEPATCVDNSPPPVVLEAPTDCSFVRDGTVITVTWAAGAGSVDTVVYRTVDGNGPYWRTRTAASEFVDSDRTGVIAYEVRARGADGTLSPSTACTNLTP